MGCMAALQNQAVFRRAPYVDLVFGSPAIARVGELVERARRERRPVLDIGEAPLVKLTTKAPTAERLRAFVTVMEGCEKHCTFCVVPRTRGRERSHSPESIVAEVRGLVAEGCREVTLLGQTVNAYGRDLTPATDLAELFQRVNDVPGLAAHPLHDLEPLQPHAQADPGDARRPEGVRVLPPAAAVGLGPRARADEPRLHARAVPGADRSRCGTPSRRWRFSTDIIVGFPGETEADFEETLAVVEQVGYDNAFVFRYSRRPGTPAADMAEQVPEPVKAERNAPHARGGRAERRRREPAPAGRTVEVLVDGVSRKSAAELSGRTRCNRVVNFERQGRVAIGDIVHVRVTDVLPHSLRGALATPEEAVCSSR